MVCIKKPQGYNQNYHDITKTAFFYLHWQFLWYTHSPLYKTCCITPPENYIWPSSIVLPFKRSYPIGMRWDVTFYYCNFILFSLMKTFPYYSQSLLWIVAFVFSKYYYLKNIQVKKIVVNTKHPKMCLRSENKFRNQNKIPYFTVLILYFSTLFRIDFSFDNGTTKISKKISLS